MTSLTEETLTRLNPDVALPRYDRREVTTGIVHIGVGNFHRSHQAMYIDTLMNSGAAMNWGICGIGLQPSNVALRDALAAQDGLYTLVVRHGDGTWDARVIGSIVEYLFAPDDPEAAIEKMAAPSTRIVSLTVTEGGYNLGAVTGEFNASDETVMADLRQGAVPRTVFGLVTEALAVCARAGITLPRPPGEAVDEAIAEAYDHKPSMLQDVLARRPTEIDVLNGGIAAEGRRAGVPTPLHDCMVALVKGLERSWST